MLCFYLCLLQTCDSDADCGKNRCCIKYLGICAPKRGLDQSCNFKVCMYIHVFKIPSVYIYDSAHANFTLNDWWDRMMRVRVQEYARRRSSLSPLLLLWMLLLVAEYECIHEVVAVEGKSVYFIFWECLVLTRFLVVFVQDYHGCGCEEGLFCQVAKCFASYKYYRCLPEAWYKKHLVIYLIVTSPKRWK